MTIDEKINLFFFDPFSSRDDYIKLYKKLNPDRVVKEKGKYRYSPLFLCLKDMHYCYGIGKEFNTVREKLNFVNFAGIILVDLCFRNTVKRFYYGNFERFAKEYMGIEEARYIKALRNLRNALEHSYYSLFIYEDRKGIKTKIYFSLGYYDFPIKQNENFQASYPAEMYMVNPRMLCTVFEKGIKKLGEDLKSIENQKLRNKFLENFNIDEWVVTGP